MAIRRFSIAEPGVKSNKFWDQDTQQGAIVPIVSADVISSSYGRYFQLNSIPQIYQDLRIVCRVRTDAAATTDVFGLYLNQGEGGTINSQTVIVGDGASASSSREQNLFTLARSNIVANNATAGIFSSVTIDILNYTNTSNFKTIISRSATDLNGSGNTALSVSLARITSAVSSISIGAVGSGTNLVPGSSIVLYGIKAGA